MSTTLDARGLSCPQPVLMTLKALADSREALVVEVDNETAAENVERACREKGRQAEIIKTDTGYSVQVAVG